tara:strand:+ start:246 stop:521 length:276 start_codon:yes stop_codon:yes gene_type:complete
MDYNILVGVLTVVFLIVTTLWLMGYDKTTWSKGITEGLRVRYEMERARIARKKKYAIYTHKYQIEHKQAVKAVDAEEELNAIPNDGSWLNR